MWISDRLAGIFTKRSHPNGYKLTIKISYSHCKANRPRPSSLFLLARGRRSLLNPDQEDGLSFMTNPSCKVLPGWSFLGVSFPPDPSAQKKGGVFIPATCSAPSPTQNDRQLWKTVSSLVLRTWLVIELQRRAYAELVTSILDNFWTMLLRVGILVTCGWNINKFLQWNKILVSHDLLKNTSS